jgi:serine protease Do
MFTTLLLSLSAALPPQLQASADEKYRRRITPIVEVVDAAAPAVVYIHTDLGVKHSRDLFGRIFSQQLSGQGSGVVILKEGFIITNYHVVKGAQRIQVTFDKRFDEQEYPAQLVSFVEQEDLALLKITRARDFPTIPLGTSSDLMVGETVVAIGNPYGQMHTATDGIISGLHRDVEIPSASLDFSDLIQTSASIDPGNSGGPLLNINGELIGINSAMNVQAKNMGFAIPVDRVKAVLEDQLLSPDTAPTWLGFDVEPGDHLQIAKVVPGSPASVAGLRPGDCIVEVGGRPVSRQDDYRLARVGLPPQREIELRIERSGVTRKVHLTPWDKVDGILFENLGLKVERVAIDRSAYIRVADVRPGGTAAELGLQPGDLLDGMRIFEGTSRSQTLRIDSREKLAQLVSMLPSGSSIEVDIYRDLDGDDRYEREELHRGSLRVE